MNFVSIRGGCHCGNIRFELEWPKSEAVIPVRKCSCDFCSKHGGAWTSHSASGLVVNIDDASTLSRYSFATKTAEFFVCTSCGVVPLVVSEIDEKLYAVVNVNSFEDAESLAFSSSATDFGGETKDSRLQRRERNWIPNVRMTKKVLSS